MKKTKILIIGMSFKLGGIETFVYNLIKNADREKFQFDFLYMTSNKLVFEEELKAMGCKMFNITPRKLDYKKHKEELKNFFKNNEYDFIHYNVMEMTWPEVILYANKYSKTKIILHSHTAGFDKNASLKSKMIHMFRNEYDKKNFIFESCLWN